MCVLCVPFSLYLCPPWSCQRLFCIKFYFFHMFASMVYTSCGFIFLQRQRGKESEKKKNCRISQRRVFYDDQKLSSNPFPVPISLCLIIVNTIFKKYFYQYDTMYQSIYIFNLYPELDQLLLYPHSPLIVPLRDNI